MAVRDNSRLVIGAGVPAAKSAAMLGFRVLPLGAPAVEFWRCMGWMHISGSTVWRMSNVVISAFGFRRRFAWRTTVQYWMMLIVISYCTGIGSQFLELVVRDGRSSVLSCCVRTTYSTKVYYDGSICLWSRVAEWQSGRVEQTLPSVMPSSTVR